MVPGIGSGGDIRCLNLRELNYMRAAIHPEYKTINVTCSCGHSFKTGSTLCRDLNIEVCSECHPFYTGKQKLVDTGGRVQKFRDRYKDRAATKSAE